MPSLPTTEPTLQYMASPSSLSEPEGPAINPGEGALLSFFDAEGAGLALLQEAFTPMELVSTIVSHVRDSDPRISQKGIDQFLKMTLKLAELNGLVGHTTVERSQESANGTRTVQRASLTRLSNSRPKADSLPGAQLRPAKPD